MTQNSISCIFAKYVQILSGVPRDFADSDKYIENILNSLKHELTVAGASEFELDDLPSYEHLQFFAVYTNVFLSKLDQLSAIVSNHLRLSQHLWLYASANEECLSLSAPQAKRSFAENVHSLWVHDPGPNNVTLLRDALLEADRIKTANCESFTYELKVEEMASILEYLSLNPNSPQVDTSDPLAVYKTFCDVLCIHCRNLAFRVKVMRRKMSKVDPPEPDWERFLSDFAAISEGEGK